MSSTDRGRAPRTSRNIGVAAALGSLVFAAVVGLTATVSTAAPGARPGSPVFIGADGKLGGPMTGYSWVAAGSEASIAAPSPCNAQGCFKDTRGSALHAREHAGAPVHGAGHGPLCLQLGHELGRDDWYEPDAQRAVAISRAREHLGGVSGRGAVHTA